MTRKRWVFAASLLIMAGGVVLFTALYGTRGTPPPDPVIQGRAVSLWVTKALKTGEYEDTQRLRELGTNVVPHLTRALERRSTVLNTASVKAWSYLPARLQSRLEQPVLARETRLRAVVALREIGSAGKAGIPDLIKRLADPDRQIRLHTAISLGEFGQDSAGALPSLEPFLKDESHTVRVYSANAMWKITHQQEPVLTVLEEGLRDKAASFRWAAAVFLGEMGPAAERSIPLLAEATKDSDKEVASLAVQALAEISPKALPILTNLLLDPDPNLRISACAALGKLGPAGKEAVPMLVKLAEDRATGSPAIMGRPLGSESVRSRALEVLEKIDPAAASALTGTRRGKPN